MPRKNDTKRPQHEIDQAVKRFLDGGEQAVVLAKLYKISKAGFYLWVKKYKQDLLDKSRRAGLSPDQVQSSDKRTLVTEVEQLRLENRKLRDKVVSLMIKAGEF